MTAKLGFFARIWRHPFSEKYRDRPSFSCSVLVEKFMNSVTYSMLSAAVGWAQLHRAHHVCGASEARVQGGGHDEAVPTLQSLATVVDGLEYIIVLMTFCA
jgi:hypothetical protein